MSIDVKITYVNNCLNKDKPTIFVFTRNQIPTFSVLEHGVAWKTIANIGRRSSNCFVYTAATYVQAAWGNCNKTALLESQPGRRYTIEEDDTGIVMVESGQATQRSAIEVASSVNVPGGIRAQIIKDGSPLMVKNIVAYGQKATFILHPKLYWGIASEIREGQAIGSAVMNTDHFWVQDIESIESATVTLVGNAKEGYRFLVKNNI